MLTVRIPAVLCAWLALINLDAQVILNEGSSRNYRTLADENGEFHDWVELYNTTDQWLDLEGYCLSDDSTNATMWTFPSTDIAPHGHLVVFCSGYDRLPQEGLTTVAAIQDHTPTAGWNTHPFATPFTWDGISNILDRSVLGERDRLRLELRHEPDLHALPVDRLGVYRLSERGVRTARGQRFRSSSGDPAERNDHRHERLAEQRDAIPGTLRQLGLRIQARHALHRSGTQAAGLTAGDISSLAFDVVEPNGGFFDAIDIRIGHVNE
ncbi:MAG: lamin tail domain-containing protein [Flavobacteriales bacterium]